MQPILPRLTVNFLLFETFSNMMLACLLELLRVVRDDTGADLTRTILSHTDEPVISSIGLKVTPDTTRAAANACDILIVIGGDQFRAEAQDPAFAKSLRQTKRAATVIAADTGTWLMAAPGFLDGRQATLHWQLLVEFAEAFPAVTVVPDRFVQDGLFLTCGGASTALDLILAEISHRFGQTAKFDAASMFLHDYARPNGPTEKTEGFSANRPVAIRKVLTLMASRLEHPMSLKDLASGAGVTLRSMAGLFLDQVGMPPGKYYQLLRLSRAKGLATHTNLPLGEIALRCGFSGASALSRAFSLHYGVGPRSGHRRHRIKPGNS